MKLSKTIDQTRICKKSYDDPLGYFCMGLFFFYLSRRTSDQQIHLSRTIGQTLLSRSAPYPWYINPPTHGILTSLSMVF
jgi:hypothetical protein